MARRSAREWEGIVATALRHADDIFALEESPLAEDEYIRQLARERYPRRALMYGHAVRAALGDAARTASEGLDPRFRDFCTAYAGGAPLTRIAQHLGISREHLSRQWRPRAVTLITAQLRASMTGDPVPRAPLREASPVAGDDARIVPPRMQWPRAG